MTDQLDAAGRLRHLLTLDGLPAPMLQRLIERARTFVPPPAAAAPADAPAALPNDAPAHVGPILPTLDDK